MKHLKRFFKHGNLIFLGVLTFMLLVIILLFAPVRPLEIRSVEIKGDSFKAGGEMVYDIDRCKNLSQTIPGTASRYFVPLKKDGSVDTTKQSVFISSTDDLGDKGCAKIERTLDIPAHIKDGKYKLKFVTRYFPSVIREPITVDYTTRQSFTIEGQDLSSRLNSILAELEVVREELGGESSDNTSQDEISVEPGTGSDQVANAAPQAEQSAEPEQLNTLPNSRNEEQPTSGENTSDDEEQSRTLSDEINGVTNQIIMLLPRV